MIKDDKKSPMPLIKEYTLNHNIQTPNNLRYIPGVVRISEQMGSCSSALGRWEGVWLLGHRA